MRTEQKADAAAQVVDQALDAGTTCGEIGHTWVALNSFSATERKAPKHKTCSSYCKQQIRDAHIGRGVLDAK